MSQGGVYGTEFASEYQLYVAEELDDERVGEYITTLFEWDQADPEANWAIVLNCPGGSTESGTVLYETIRSYARIGGGSHFVTCIAAGQCSSMATLVLQAADWRVAGRLTYSVFHEVVTGTSSGTIGSVEADLKMISAWNDQADACLLERTDLSLPIYRKLIKGHPWILLGEEMLKFKLVDEVR